MRVTALVPEMWPLNSVLERVQGLDGSTVVLRAAQSRSTSAVLPVQPLAALERLLATKMNSWTGRPSAVFREFNPVFSIIPAIHLPLQQLAKRSASSVILT